MAVPVIWDNFLLLEQIALSPVAPARIFFAPVCRAGEIHEMFDAFGPQQPTVWAAFTTKNTNDTKILE